MNEIITTILDNPFYHKLLLTVLVLVLQAAIRHVLIKAIMSLVPDDSPHLYTLHKVSVYFLNMLIALYIFGIWVKEMEDLSMALGILGAGIAFALQEVIGGVAGWFLIIFGHPFSIGDRIELNDIQGDVVDIGVLRTTVMEMKNWLHGDHNTGRLVSISNAAVLKASLFNYSARLPFIWDELQIPVTYETDWEQAAEILRRAVRENPRYQKLIPLAKKRRTQTRREFAIKMTPLQPRVFVNPTDNWIELGLVYPVDFTMRRVFHHEISCRILKDLKAAGMGVASQTIAIVEFPSTKNNLPPEVSA
ncbi:MAG: mechanosensitive ion channel [Chloroflexota bacterium]|nr:mechanosensitive ion channel [Chloroflexota bacterium]